MNISLKIRHLAKKIILHSSRHDEASIILKMANFLAKFMGVPSPLTARANSIFLEEMSPVNSIRLLSCFARLKLNMKIPGFSFNISNMLKTEEEKCEAIDLLYDAYINSRSDSKKDNIMIQMIRLCNDLYNMNCGIYFIKNIIVNEYNSTANSSSGSHSKTLVKYGLKELMELKTIFDKHDKVFFLISGTLLGALRENNFIAGDNDIDLGIFIEDISPTNLKEMMISRGYYLLEDCEYKLSYISKRNVFIEFFFFYEHEDRMLIPNCTNFLAWEFSRFSLKKYNFNGIEFLIPDDHDLYLSENYGNWSSGSLFYDCFMDTPCGIFRNNLEALLYLSQAFRDAVQRRDRFAAEFLARELAEKFDLDYRDLFPDRGDA